MKIYVTLGVFVLICITSAGIYGFLSSAFQETYQKLSISQNQIKFLKQKETFYLDDVARYDMELLKISNNITLLSSAKASAIQVKDPNSKTGFRNTISTTELRLSQKRILVEEKNREGVIIKRSTASDSLQKYQLSILEKENNGEVSGELGPLVYISNLTNTPMDKVVNYFILLLIFVFDPLAISLVIATNWVFEQERKKLKPSIIEEIPPKNVIQPIEETLIEPVKIIVPPTNIVEDIKFTTPLESDKIITLPTNIVGDIKVSTPPTANIKPTIKNSDTGLNKDDVKIIRKNARNFSKKIPVRRGY